MVDGRWDKNNVINRMISEVSLPKMVRIRQRFPSQSVSDLAAEVHVQLSQEKISSSVKPGMRIAITAGSRGLDRYPELMRSIVREIRQMGGEPFLIPAMGSHGGGTAEGQTLMLKNLGITEESVGAPIYSSMEVVQIGVNCDGLPVFIDRYAAQADGIVVVNRVKPHTNFRGVYESGLMKMMTIGLGKQVGAATCHSLSMDDMTHNIFAFGSTILENANILFGVATVENAQDRTQKIVALTPEEIPTEEPKLQELAKQSMPRIRFSEFDVLIVDQIGKNFSGPGMDPNITGISGNPNIKLKPEVQRRVVLDLSDETHGNGIGIGLADFSTKRAFDKLDMDAIYPNSLTSRSTAGGKIPIILRNDEMAVKAAVYTCIDVGNDGVKIVRIPNTLHIEEIEISTALLPQAEADPDIDILSDPQSFEFDSDGNLF